MKRIFAKTQYHLTGRIQIERTDWTNAEPTFRMDLLKDDPSGIVHRELSLQNLNTLRDEITSILEMNK